MKSSRSVLPFSLSTVDSFLFLPADYLPLATIIYGVTLTEPHI